MSKVNDTEPVLPDPLVEVHVGSKGLSAAAGEADTRLSPEQMDAIQQTVNALVLGFRPPDSKVEDDKIGLNSLEVSLGFTVQAGSGPALKLFLDASAEASIIVKVVWSRKK